MVDYELGRESRMSLQKMRMILGICTETSFYYYLEFLDVAGNLLKWRTRNGFLPLVASEARKFSIDPIKSLKRVGFDTMSSEGFLFY